MGAVDSHAFANLFKAMSNPIFIGIAATFLFLLLSTMWRVAKVLWIASAIGVVSYAIARIYKALQPKFGGKKDTITMPSIDKNGHQVAVPVFHATGINGGAMVIGIVIALIAVILHFGIKQAGYSWGYVLRRVLDYVISPVSGRAKDKQYTHPPVVIGTGIGEAEPGLPGANAKAGKKIHIQSADRFLNMGIIGPIGSGKTFMTMKPQIYQDIEGISQGVMGNIVWISPQPEPSVESYAEKLGLTVRRIHIIDGQMNGKGTNIRFNPLSGSNIDDIVNNVNVVLNEQSGTGSKGDPFFETMAAQATTDSLQLYKYLHGIDATTGERQEIDFIGWYDDYLVKMDELFYESQRVIAVSRGLQSPDPRVKEIAANIWPQITEHEKVMLIRAANSIINEFGGNVEGKSAESYKNIIRGLRGKVRVLISSQFVQELLGKQMDKTADRPNFDFESWIDPVEWMKQPDETMEGFKKNAPARKKGELLSVITGQTETGKLVGRMVLVFLQQGVLNRPGKDNDKPGVYTYVDEYPSYATKSINEIRTQGRKHCHSMVAAMQSRAQLEAVAQGYLETFEGSCRHWVYLSNLGADDAKSVAELAGEVKREKITRQDKQIRFGGLGKDDGRPISSKTRQEELVPRFSQNFIRYDLKEDEVIYVGVENRKGQNPLRMRIVQPKENQKLIKLVNSPQQPTKVKPTKPKKTRKTEVYPSREQLARAMKPILTFRGNTLYWYHWGVSVKRDGDPRPIDDFMEKEAIVVEPLRLLEPSWDDIMPKSAKIRETMNKAPKPNKTSDESGDAETKQNEPEEVIVSETSSNDTEFSNKQVKAKTTESNAKPDSISRKKINLLSKNQPQPQPKEQASPQCPSCRGKMARRRNGKGEYWGCVSDQCRGRRDIEQDPA
ncbi:type IV secretion system DNA-binding domain-containing protein [Alicyclobacillus fodiniaquatilis]|uniref:Type IV secretion system DNA-binding domain-containing protein n=1 Tax=Alicyclobacillus fodiniaquatilis TaxID=1661150 RepID=A0ABW4JKP8_9BACL